MGRKVALALGTLLAIGRLASPQGMPVGPEFRVNTFTTSSQRVNAVGSDPSGNFVVVWSSYAQDLSDLGVYGQRYDSSGVPLGPEFRVNSYTTNVQCCGSIAFDSAGDFVVVWASVGQDGSAGGVFGQRYSSSGAPLGSEFRVNTYTPGYQDSPAVASDGGGNFVVVWKSDGQDGSLFGIFGQRYSSSGAPLGGEFRVNTYTTGFQQSPALAADPSGNFVVVWQDGGQDGSLFGVFGQRFSSSGAPVGPEFRVNTSTTDSQSAPSVASDSSGNFVVVWDSNTQVPQNHDVFGQRYLGNGSPLGGEFRVNTYTTSDQGFPSVASDASGNFVVVWDAFQQDGSVLGVYGQRYASSGAPLGPEFRVNTYTTGYQAGSTVSSDPAGNFVVAWTSDQEGSGYGVYAQRYEPIVPIELTHFGVE